MLVTSTIIGCCFQPEIDAAVKQLLALKAEYKAATGNDWKPGQTAPAKAASAATTNQSDSAADLNNKITEQGDLVRKLKSEKAAKVSL